VQAQNIRAHTTTRTHSRNTANKHSHTLATPQTNTHATLQNKHSAHIYTKRRILTHTQAVTCTDAHGNALVHARHLLVISKLIIAHTHSRADACTKHFCSYSSQGVGRSTHARRVTLPSTKCNKRAYSKMSCRQRRSAYPRATAYAHTHAHGSHGRASSPLLSSVQTTTKAEPTTIAIKTCRFRAKHARIRAG
jgi:hypothetical protein